MEGGKDPDCRRSFPWDERRWDTGLLAHFKQLIALRKQYRALRDGSFKVLFAQDGVVAVLRQWQDEYIVVVFNRTETARRLDLDTAGLIPDGIVLHDHLNGSIASTAAGKLGNIRLPPMSGALLI